MIRRSRPVATLAFAMLTLSTAGCGPTADISARIVDGKFEFAMCSKFAYQRIFVFDEDGHNLAWSTFGVGPAAGTPIVYGESLARMEDVAGPAALNLNSDVLLVQFKSESATYFARFDPQDIDGQWVSGDGDSRGAPCD